MSRRVPRIERQCIFCGTPFLTVQHLLDIGKGRFCSRPCAYRHQRAAETTVENLAKRFVANVDTDGPVPSHRPQLGPCHVWTGRRNELGYGKLGFRGKDERAHRVAFFLAEGRWPEPCALHACDNPSCVRRSHLFEGTKKENTADMIAKGRARYRPLRGEEHWSHFHPERVARGDRNGARTRPDRVPRGDRCGARTKPERVPRGEAAGMSKLTNAQVIEIRSQREQGVLLRVLATRFGVTEALVCAIAKRRVWRHI